ncbi:DUF1681-domain-containing protein [Terfezia boudieri ATCC MYA-4762]|uniref:DUF1681-domain-containing protein n=1 Tax=Terfezia boudieri ATCC MYA-4762 TaxID=1051890 RepID=A0A3N4L9L4_9PEZI|nr:DUF1681-domain-containing protein [Terfezia boudieri ATCC MYA-4762]
MSADAPTTIRRDLFTKNRVHIYPIPPLKSISSGYKASDWGVDRESSRIFTARLRVVETTTILTQKPTSTSSPSGSDSDEEERKITTDVRLEDPDSAELFANCPYTSAVCVEQVLDSSRFFAICVVDGKRKAYLGIGFEDRGAAFDFGVCLQEVRRHNNLDAPKPGTTRAEDYSLKEGETIKITIGNKGRRKPSPSSPPSITAATGQNSNPPLPLLPPPPSAVEEKKRRRESYKQAQTADISGWASAQDWAAFETPTTTANERGKGLGFDDDPFGDFV